MKKFWLLFLLVFTSIFVDAQRFRSMHNAAIVIDAHNDIPGLSIQKKIKFDSNLEGQTHSDLSRMKEGGVDIQIFSIFCGPEKEEPFAFANQMIDSVYAWTARNPGKMMIVKTPAQLANAVKEKKIGAMMGVEGGHMIEDKLSNLEALFDRGARYMTLTWNNSTSWATSAQDEMEKADSLPHKGLTTFGKQVVKRMNELGILVDVSHTGEQTFYDIIATTTKPVIASHSNAWSLCKHRRNLKDEQIKAIAKNGGVIHLNFYAGFIDSTYELKYNAFTDKHKREIDSMMVGNATSSFATLLVGEKYKEALDSIRPSISALIDHLDYIVKLVGINHVGLGSDFDGIEAPPLELSGVEDFPLITKALMERGYSKKDIRKILGGNFLRVFKAAQPAG